MATILSNPALITASIQRRKQTLTAGRLIVISGPSGAGKTTVLKQLLALEPRLESSVSATTRSPRPGEVPGVAYHFLTSEEFALRRERGEFVECFEVYGSGNWYGTLWSEVTPRLQAGKWVVLEIDVAGAMAVIEKFPEAVTIFIQPASEEELERRLRGRATESEAVIQRRLAVAKRELEYAPRYQWQVTNHAVDQAVEDIRKIFTQIGD